MPNYPRTVAEVLSDRATYRPEALRALRALRRSRPWSGDIETRKAKFQALHACLCRVYGIDFSLRFLGLGATEGNGSCNRLARTITLTGRLSVVTYLHELAHARFGACERRACRWSLNLFRKAFPRQWGRLRFSGHRVLAS